MEPLLLTIDEAARMAGIGRDAVIQFLDSKAWPYETVGKRKRMIPRAFLLQKYGLQPSQGTEVQAEDIAGGQADA